MLISLFVVLIALLGLLMYVLSSNPKVSEIGRILFFCGAMVTCYLLSGRTVRVL